MQVVEIVNEVRNKINLTLTINKESLFHYCVLCISSKLGIFIVTGGP